MLSLEEKIGQMLGVGFHGLEPPDYILKWLASGRIGTLVLFARNVASPAQLAELTQACHEAARHGLLIAIDQEGGMVTRLRQGFTESPGAMALGAANSELLAEEVSAAMGTELRALGINWNLAPVVDLIHDPHNPSVGTRSLGADKKRVSQLAAAQIRGFQKTGVAATAKHFPGLGNTPVDTHDAMAIINTSLDDLQVDDLLPFRAAVEADVAAVMVTHVTFPAVDPHYPGTFSQKLIQGVLREEIGFHGLVCTDCMEMRAISDHYTPGESAILAAQAGHDVIFFSHSFSPDHANHIAAYDALLNAVKSGRIPVERIDEAARHVLSVKSRFAVKPTYAPELIRHADHLAVMKKAAQAGIIAARVDSSVLPLNPDDRRHIALIEFASFLDSEVMEHGGETNFAGLLHRCAPTVASVAIKPGEPDEQAVRRARELAAKCDLLVLATRNAHLISSQRDLAQEFLELAKQSILLCLRNPYDMQILPGASSVLCTCGDSAPSLEAAVDALMGHFIPSGSLPVPVEQHP